MDDILGASRAGYKRRDTLLSIKEKLNKHYIIVVSFRVFICAVASLLFYLVLQLFTNKEISNIMPACIFLVLLAFIPYVTRHPIYILSRKEFEFMKCFYSDVLYNENGNEYISAIFRDDIQYELDTINKRIGELGNSEFYGWSDSELHKYIQILDRVTEIESKKKLVNRLLKFLNKQVPESCLLAGTLISSYPVAIFSINELTAIKSNPYLLERFKLALINNKSNVNESFKNDVTAYLSNLESDLNLTNDEALEFRKCIDQQKHLEFVNAM